MGDVVVETVYTFPYVFVGVGESVVARKVIPHSFLIERLTVVMPGPRLSRWLRADDLNHVEIESLKIGGDEQIDEPIPGSSLVRDTTAMGTVRLHSMKTVEPGSAITVTLRDHGRLDGSMRRACRRMLLHRQPIVLLAQGAEIRPFGTVIGTTATPMRDDGAGLPWVVSRSARSQN